MAGAHRGGQQHQGVGEEGVEAAQAGGLPRLEDEGRGDESEEGQGQTGEGLVGQQQAQCPRSERGGGADSDPLSRAQAQVGTQHGEPQALVEAAAPEPARYRRQNVRAQDIGGIEGRDGRELEAAGDAVQPGAQVAGRARPRLGERVDQACRQREAQGD